MNPPRSDSTVAFIGDVSVSNKKISTSNFSDYIGDVSVGKMSEQRVADKVNGVRESPDNGNWCKFLFQLEIISFIMYQLT